MKTYIAHIIIEAKIALKVGSNENNFLKDSPIQKDWNGLPMILGTSITGVLRKEFEGDKNYIFGDDCSKFKINNEYEKYKKCKEKEEGSRVIVSNGLLLDKKMKVNETLLLNKSDFLQNFENLPIREHTAINHKGVTKEHSKFDEEVVFKGTRFKFSIEMKDDKEKFEKVLDTIYNQTFRLGGGTTKGYGKIEVVKISYQEFTDEGYINFENSLNFELTKPYEKKTKKTFTIYKLKLKPDDFFIFGSGFGDKDVDMIQTFEDVIEWENDTPIFKQNQVLIPASSIKGAISHRVAYHYNKDNKIFADKISEKEFNEYQEENNPAVVDIFGHKKESKNNKELGQKGKVLISDCFKSDFRDKVFDHVAIDRFTGGAIDGALFQEKVINTDEFEIEIVLSKKIKYKDIFEKTLKDICEGRLPLGGMTTKGHGFFSGELYRNGEKI